MHTAVKIGGFAVGLLVIFGAAAGIGAAVTPTDSAVDQPAANHSAQVETVKPAEAEIPGGLLVSADGYRLQLDQAILPAGAQVPLSFHILGPDGRPVTGYDTEHDKDLHLIVVRRDLTQFQHLHPVLDPDGSWRVPADLEEAGDYRVFADFTPAGHDGGLVLGTDLSVAGPYQPVSLPAPATVTDVDGYTVTLAGELIAGQSAPLTLSVSKDGAPVTDLEPYLAAYGHLVALRAGDLAYLHVHPAGAPGDGVTPAGPGVTFYATVPSAGDYRLFLDFQHGGVVRTADFTVQAEPATTAAGLGEPAAETHGH